MQLTQLKKDSVTEVIAIMELQAKNLTKELNLSMQWGRGPGGLLLNISNELKQKPLWIYNWQFWLFTDKLSDHNLSDAKGIRQLP